MIMADEFGHLASNTSLIFEIQKLQFQTQRFAALKKETSFLCENVILCLYGEIINQVFGLVCVNFFFFLNL